MFVHAVLALGVSIWFATAAANVGGGEAAGVVVLRWVRAAKGKVQAAGVHWLPPSCFLRGELLSSRLCNFQGSAVMCCLHYPALHHGSVKLWSNRGQARVKFQMLGSIMVGMWAHDGCTWGIIWSNPGQT